MTKTLQLILQVLKKSHVKTEGLNQQDDLRYMKDEGHLKLSVLPHLALPLLVSSKELSNLVQEPGVLLPPAQPESSLRGAACRCHFCKGGLVVYLSTVGFLVALFNERTKRREKRGRERGKKAYSRSSLGFSDPQSEAAPLCSWMVCNSSDSDGRFLKVLSSRPGASREKRRARWGRGVAASGSAVLAGVQGWRGPSAPVESVTTGFCETQPLFWFASASPRPVQKQQGSSMG